MKYRIIRSFAGKTEAMTEWASSPKGYGVLVNELNTNEGGRFKPGRYWLEEAPRTPALPVTGLAAISDVRSLKRVVHGVAS